MTVEIALEILRTLNRYGPQVAADVAALFSKKEITVEDWQVIFERAKTPFDAGLIPGVLQPAAKGERTDTAATPNNPGQPSQV